MASARRTLPSPASSAALREHQVEPQNVAGVILETYQGGSAAFAPADYMRRSAPVVHRAQSAAGVRRSAGRLRPHRHAVGIRALRHRSRPGAVRQGHLQFAAAGRGGRTPGRDGPAARRQHDLDAHRQSRSAARRRWPPSIWCCARISPRTPRRMGAVLHQKLCALAARTAADRARGWQRTGGRRRLRRCPARKSRMPRWPGTWCERSVEKGVLMFSPGRLRRRHHQDLPAAGDHRSGDPRKRRRARRGLRGSPGRAGRRRRNGLPRSPHRGRRHDHARSASALALSHAARRAASAHIAVCASRLRHACRPWPRAETLLRAFPGQSFRAWPGPRRCRRSRSCTAKPSPACRRARSWWWRCPTSCTYEVVMAALAPRSARLCVKPLVLEYRAGAWRSSAKPARAGCWSASNITSASTTAA